jgi:uncharacterized glyoxalase superfamily protein PhnB
VTTRPNLSLNANVLFILYVASQEDSAAFYTRIPRSEVYLLVDDPDTFHHRALSSGALELSPLAERDWGDLAAYSLDPDGHVLVFARPVPARES